MGAKPRFPEHGSSSIKEQRDEDQPEWMRCAGRVGRPGVETRRLARG
jgi:hypothetical protein